MASSTTTSHRQGISFIRKENSELTGSLAIAEEFNTYFSSCAKISQDASACKQTAPSPPKVQSVFSFKGIDEDMMLGYLNKLNVKKATGTDSISAKLLKMAAPAIAESLTSLFNHSLETGEIPSEWKAACVTPVPKKGDKQSVKNYRPVSVLPVVAKVFEAMVHAQLFNYLENNSLLHDAQSGFRPLRNTQDVLIRSVDDWRRALDQDKITGTIMIDLSKAFDSIDHQLLLEKLEAYGVAGKEKMWFREYLSGRKQQVSVNGVKSSWNEVKLGVPQGSILGPLLFTMFVNDLPDVLDSCSVNLYADDTMIYYSHRDPQQVKEVLERELEAIMMWIQQNHLRMNVAKTHLLVFSRRHRRKEVEEFTIQHRGASIKPRSEVKYLGVVVDEDLTWRKHLQEVRKKCLIGLSQLRQISQFLPMKTRKTLYNALVLPHLDYCCVVWHECGATQSERIERLQNNIMV